VVRVDVDNVKGPWDGNSWATAYRTVQQGLAAARAGDEVWAAEGTYRPTSTSDRAASFQLKPGVGLYGGFKGTETKRSERDWRKNVTILSGDIGKEGDTSDNSYHVVVGADDAVLDGFTITGGNGVGARGTGPRQGPRGRGPGMGPPPFGPPARRGGRRRPIHTSPQAIMGGMQATTGGGMVNYQCAPTIRNCTFRENRAGKGGAIYNMVTRVFPPHRQRTQPPAPTISHCTFLNNYARGRGGAVANDLATSPTFIHCRFRNNTTEGKGGAIYNDFACSPTITNCLFVGNAAHRAGAIGNDGGSSPVLTCCTFTRNEAEDFGAALYQGSGPSNNPVLTRCILWDNRCEAGPAEIVNWHHCQPKVTGSCVQGGYPGERNIDADPKFVDPDSGDFRLAPDSPCPNAGHTAKAPKVATPRPPWLRRRPPSRRDDRPPSRLPAQAVVYVNAAHRQRPEDGKSWETAYSSLQKGIDHAWRSGAEVWVAAGTYRPTPGTERSASFQLRPGVAVYGGFAGTETKRDQRDPAKHVTVLSGDIGKPGDRRDNAYHVLRGADRATLDGFTITGGNANGQSADGKGGGMVNYYGERQRGPLGPVTGLSPTVTNCVFRDNHAVEGGAIYNFDRCTPKLTHCTFEQNWAHNGGAIVDRVGVKTTLSRCIFRSNRARWRGGALYIDYGSRPRITDCTFVHNGTDGHGGALYALSRSSQLEHSIPTLRNCTFTANVARLRGGAIANADSSLLMATACSFARNRAGTGGGALALDYRARATLRGCTFQDNSADKGKPDVDRDDSSRVTVRGR